MRIDLRYGAGSLPLEISQRLVVDTLLPQIAENPIDSEDAVPETIEHPIDAEPFSKLASEVKSIALVVNGETDIEITSMLLLEILDYLRDVVAVTSDISVIFPTMSNKSKSSAASISSATDYRIVQHDAYSKDNLTYLGETPSHCTPLYVNQVLMDASLKVGIGTIRPDSFVGATGGRMSILPYGSGIKSISRNARLIATHPSGPFQTDSAVCTDLEEASRLACLNFIINAVPDRNDNLHSIVAGNPYSAWREGVSHSKYLSQSKFQYKADIAIVSAGGAPHDSTLYAATDALHAGKAITEHGGVVVLVAECNEGGGYEGFVQGVSECNSSRDVSLLAETGFEIGMEKARLFWDVLSTRKVIICSRMRDSLVRERFHCAPVRDPQEGLELAKSYLVSRPRIAVIPYGGRSVPIMDNS